jgi:repressor LexA
MEDSMATDDLGPSDRSPKGDHPLDRDSLSPRQIQVLDLIKATVANRGYPPSVREIGERLGLRSPSTVHSHISALVREGFILRDPSKPRALQVLDVHDPEPAVSRGRTRDVPLLGRIAAGTPILAEESIEDVMPLPESLTGSGPVFMLKVKGDSMIDAGILDGDLVVIASQKDAQDGEIVAFLVGDDEATVKRLERKDGSVILHSENAAYEPMVFTSGVEILGKVISVLRSLR